MNRLPFPAAKTPHAGNHQTLTVDRNKRLDRLEFSLFGVTDRDADFGIYALSAIGLLGLSFVGWRRRKSRPGRRSRNR